MIDKKNKVNYLTLFYFFSMFIIMEFKNERTKMMKN